MTMTAKKSCKEYSIYEVYVLAPSLYCKNVLKKYILRQQQNE